MSILCVDHSLCYVHIPKTGGVSMSTYLKIYAGGKEFLRRSYGSKHMDIHRTKRELKKKKIHVDYWFTIVRNPWDRMVSAHHYYLRQKTSKHSSFEEFVRSYDWGCVNKQQHEYIDSSCSVFRFENMNEVYDEISSRCNIHVRKRVNVPKLNVSKHSDYRSYYTDELAEIVSTCCAHDISLYNYTFDP